MASFSDVMTALRNADAAGDSAAASRLAQIANQMRGGVLSSGPSQAEIADGKTNGYDPVTLAPTGEATAPSSVPVDQFGDTISAATEQSIQALSAYSGGLVGGESPTRQALPETIPPEIRTRLGFMGDLGMSGLSLLGLGYSAAAGTAGEVLGGSPTNEKKLARDLMLMGEVAVPQLAGGSSVIRAASRANRAANSIPEAATDRQRQARAADDLGITPSLGMSGRTGAVLAAQGEKVPVVGNMVADDAKRLIDEIEGVFERNVSRLGEGTSASSAGASLQEGLVRYAQRFSEQSGELYRRVDELVPAETVVSTPETVRKIREALAPFENNPTIRSQLGLDQWANVADDLETGISFQALRALRTSIGEGIGKINGPLANVDQGRLKAAYASLSSDLDNAVASVGGEAKEAWARANSYHRRGRERIDGQLDRTISADSPERAFEAFAAMASDERSTANVRRMMTIKSSLGRDEWSEVSATIVDRLGRATDGAQNAAGDAFSPATFLTKWNKMSDEARRVLMPEGVRHELSQLAEVAEAVKDSNAERNLSNTGHITSGAAYALALYNAPTTTTLATAGAAVTAKAMTSQTFLRAVNRAARGDARQLRTMANGNGPFAQDATTVLRLSAAQSGTQNGAANSPRVPLGIAN